MANICETTYILGGSPAIVKDFIGTIDSLIQKYNRAEFSDIAAAYDINIQEERLDTRGYVFGHDDIYIDDNGKTKVMFYTESKWADCDNLYNRIKENLGDVTLSYIALEPGNGLFNKHDEDNDFIDKECVVDCYGGMDDIFGGEDLFDTTTYEDAISDWFNLMGKNQPKNMSYDELINIINSYDEYISDDIFYNIYPLHEV